MAALNSSSFGVGTVFVCFFYSGGQQETLKMLENLFNVYIYVLLAL